jgi:hypothetical protein
MKNVIPSNQHDQQFIDTLQRLRQLKNRLESKHIDQDQFLLHIRAIKQQSEKINALFKPTNEFNYWFTSNNYRANRMAKIIECLETTYPTMLLREQSIGSNKRSVNFPPKVDLAKTDTAKDQSYFNNNTASRVDEPKHMPIPNANDQENLNTPPLTDDIFQADNLPGRVVGSSRDNDKLKNLIGQLEVWVDEAPDGEKGARVTAKSRILDAYNRNLEALNLSSLSLTTLPIGVFNYLTNLQAMNLAGNELSMLQDGVFDGLTNHLIRFSGIYKRLEFVSIRGLAANYPKVSII